MSDPDAAYGPLEVTLALTPGTGTLTLAHTDGLQFVGGDGAADSSMTFIGTLDSINAALDGLIYTPGTGYTGQVSLQITTNDMGPAFAGGSKSDADTVAITVANSQGFLATYYSNPDFTGTAVQTVDPTIDFNWNGSSPASGIDAPIGRRGGPDGSRLPKRAAMSSMPPPTAAARYGSTACW